MTVSTQQLDIPSIGLPIRKAMRPNILPILSATLLRRVDMVDIERTVIGESAAYAFGSEQINERERIENAQRQEKMFNDEPQAQRTVQLGMELR
jgi:hypothetical protein